MERKKDERRDAATNDVHVVVVRKDYHVVIPDRYIGSRRPNDGEQVDCIRPKYHSPATLLDVLDIVDALPRTSISIHILGCAACLRAKAGLLGGE